VDAATAAKLLLRSVRRAIVKAVFVMGANIHPCIPHDKPENRASLCLLVAFNSRCPMSAFGGKADIIQAFSDVRF
jgi:hypothetical protein